MERISENMKILSQPAYYAPGVRKHEIVRIHELSAQGMSAQEISDRMRVKLSVIESFLAPAGAVDGSSPPASAPAGAPKKRVRPSRAKPRLAQALTQTDDAIQE